MTLSSSLPRVCRNDINGNSFCAYSYAAYWLDQVGCLVPVVTQPSLGRPVSRPKGAFAREIRLWIQRVCFERLGSRQEWSTRRGWAACLPGARRHRRNAAVRGRASETQDFREVENQTARSSHDWCVLEEPIISRRPSCVAALTCWKQHNVGPPNQRTSRFRQQLTRTEQVREIVSERKLEEFARHGRQDSRSPSPGGVPLAVHVCCRGCLSHPTQPSGCLPSLPGAS